MKSVTDTSSKLTKDSVLELAKRERQAGDYEAVRSGQRTAQSMHLFGREIARTVVVQYKDVDFD
jgi:hypothetical protein